MNIKRWSYWKLTFICLIWFLIVISEVRGISSEANINNRDLSIGQFTRQTDGDFDTTFDVLHYRLDITIPLVTNALTGTVTITCQSLVADLDRIILDMENNLTVLAVSQGPMIITPIYNTDDNKLILPFGRVIDENDIFTITIEYSVPDNNNGFYNYEMSAYNDFSASWFPCKAFPPSDKATYDLHITVPNGVEVASLGILEDRTYSGDGLWETFHWRTDYPVATHLVGMMMSSHYVLWSDWYVTSVGDSIEVAYYIFDRDTSEARKDFINIVDALDFYSTLFGSYPFEKYGMAETEPMYYGAMEYQTMSMISSRWIRGDQTAEDGLVHELAHQWWGDAVGFDDWPSLWLSEGFAEYAAALYTEHRYGNEPFQALMAAKKDRYMVQAGTIDYNISDPVFDISHINIIYKKGAWILHMLRHVVGEDNLWLILQNYFTTYKYSFATIADFQASAEDVYGSSLAWFFDEWIYDKGYPKINSDHVIYPVAIDKYECEITLRQVQTRIQGPLFTMPMDIRLIGTSGTLDTTVWLNSESQTYTFLVPFEPQRLEIDPDAWVLMEIGSNSLIINDQMMIPDLFQLENNYPNPFNSNTTISYKLNLDNHIVVDIYDMSGKLILNLKNEFQNQGWHSVTWNGTNELGHIVSGGVYFYQVQVGNFIQIKKMVLLK